MVFESLSLIYLSPKSPCDQRGSTKYFWTLKSKIYRKTSFSTVLYHTTNTFMGCAATSRFQPAPTGRETRTPQRADAPPHLSATLSMSSSPSRLSHRTRTRTSPRTASFSSGSEQLASFQRTTTATQRGPGAPFFHERPPWPHNPSIDRVARKLQQSRPPKLDLDTIPGPRMGQLDATPTLEEKSAFPFYCPICFLHADSVFACAGCGHHVCASCLLTMVRAKIKQEDNKSFTAAHGVFSKAIPGCTVDCRGLLAGCPHCRDQDLQFKRLSRQGGDNCGGKTEEDIRTYVDSPRTIELLSSVESNKRAHDMAAETVDLAFEMAMASIILHSNVHSASHHAVQDRPETW